MNNHFVIGGGWSAGQTDLNDLRWFGHTIGINDAALWCEVKIALTMDRLWFENRWPYLKAKRVPETWVRRKCDCNVKRTDKRDNWKVFDHVHGSGLSEEPGTLYGGNSGTCGVNLAYQMSDEGDRIFLLGFDFCRGPGGEPYWYPPYPWAKPTGATSDGKYMQWNAEFAEVARFLHLKGREVYNVSNNTKLTSVPRISVEKMWEMIE